MELSNLEREYVEFLIKSPSYFTQNALTRLEGTPFGEVLMAHNRKIETYNKGLKKGEKPARLVEPSDVFFQLLERNLFDHKLLFNCEALGLQRYFFFSLSPELVDTPFLARQVDLFPTFLLELALPPDDDLADDHEFLLQEGSGSQDSLIPVTPMVFFRNGAWSRMYYDLSQVGKTHLQLTRDLGKWAYPPSELIRVMPFEESGTVPLEKKILRELDIALSTMQESAEYNIKKTTTYGNLKERRVVEECIDLSGYTRHFLHIKHVEEPIKQVLSRILQNCFCAEAFMAPNELFIDLRTVYSSHLFYKGIELNIPYEVNTLQFVDETWPCLFHEGVGVSGVKWKRRYP